MVREVAIGSFAQDALRNKLGFFVTGVDVGLGLLWVVSTTSMKRTIGLGATYPKVKEMPRCRIYYYCKCILIPNPTSEVLIHVSCCCWSVFSCLICCRGLCPPVYGDESHGVTILHSFYQRDLCLVMCQIDMRLDFVAGMELYIADRSISLHNLGGE